MKRILWTAILCAVILAPPVLAQDAAGGSAPAGDTGAKSGSRHRKPHYKTGVTRSYTTKRGTSVGEHSNKYPRARRPDE